VNVSLHACVGPADVHSASISCALLLLQALLLQILRKVCIFVFIMLMLCSIGASRAAALFGASYISLCDTAVLQIQLQCV